MSVTVVTTEERSYVNATNFDLNAIGHASVGLSMNTNGTRELLLLLLLGRTDDDDDTVENGPRPR